MWRRRSLLFLALTAPLTLGGCGWTPLYADTETGPADEELRAVKVEVIPERIGQKLMLALRSSFNPSGIDTPQRYYLRTTLTTSRLDLGVQSTGLGSRGRLDVNANFTLGDLKTGAGLFVFGSHVAESFDIVANEYSSLVAEDDARTRAVEEVRRDLVTRLTLFFQRRIAESGKKP
jgi:LPS-assembly lipoprotein